MARFPSGKVITVMNHLVSEEVLLGFSTNFFRQADEDWVPEVRIDVPQAVSKATLNQAVRQILDAAGLSEGGITFTISRWSD